MDTGLETFLSRVQRPRLLFRDNWPYITPSGESQFVDLKLVPLHFWFLVGAPCRIIVSLRKLKRDLSEDPPA
jgi:hypothetical protein